MCRQSKTGTCGNECLAGFVMFELLEVVDEHLGKLGSLFVPDSGIGIGVARIEDIGVNAGKFGRHCEVEDRNLLGGSLQDSTVKDSVDDTTGTT